MKQGIINDYAAKGQNIVDMNVAAVMAGRPPPRKSRSPQAGPTLWTARSLS